MSTKTTTVAIIGAGFFARQQALAWADMPNVTLVGVCDLSLEKAKEVAGACSALQARTPDVYSGVTEMLAARDVDIIDVATPSATHRDLIDQALAASPRLIVCQKPFCQNLAEASMVSERAEEAGTPVVVHENFRFQPWYRDLKIRLDAGELGDLYQITFRLRPGDGQGPEAYLARQPYFQSMERFLVHETAIHLVDVFRYLLGEPHSVWADLWRNNPAIKGEDAGLILLGFDHNIRALFDGNRLADHAADNPRLTMGEMLVEGSAGSITLDGYGQLWLRRHGSSEPVCVFKAVDVSRFGGGCIERLQSHLVAHLQHGKPLENTAKEYLPNLAIEEAIYRSSETGSRIRLPA